MSNHVHIACKDDGHILPRMSRWLAEGLGWSISGGIDNAADVNLYMPYTMVLEYGVAKTLTSAWFTHKETSNRGKVRAWDLAAQRFDQRLITSPVYQTMLEMHGMTTLVTPGIDLELFTVSKSRKRKGKVGLSGIVSGPRKGADWAWHLYESFKKDLLIAGSGWGVPCELIPYGRMNEFYNQLDVYICTAREEGIPAPVLEAMACGCKVVMPHPVGISSLLFGLPGVWHYENNNYEEMITAVSNALADDTARATIREAVEGYDISAWVSSNETAVNQLLEAYT
jgi:glycosyltransferase involved in cell wall biosynthesis